ncbi:LysR family transcriptional regulator [Lachnotalea sp. AF33-28]|uniref:LysR family transcriptional regulator n=1 Tax=Lachnotalea sp. AF33-28 TaxID=2292046 RepID=UPI0013144441|nr:LysR family transcriptional regulator [Lachnotalea sp. AF33-28]
MSVNFDHYKIFYYVAKYQNITFAADLLFLSQPTVSRCIQNLEAETGCRLFDRSKKGVSLTPEGRILYQYVSRACDQLFAAEKELESYRSMSEGNIRIGSSEMTMHNFLLPCLERFHSEYPGVKLQISTYTTPRALEALKEGMIDFAVITSPMSAESRFTVQNLSCFQDIAVAGTQFKELEGRPVSLQELTGYPMICLESFTSTRQFLNHFFSTCGCLLSPDVELATTDLVVPVVKRNLGIGFVPEGFAAEELARGNIFKIDLREQIPSRYICAVTDHTRPQSEAGRRFLDMLPASQMH